MAVITGAGAGIGAGLARYAATQLEMTVVLADVDTAATDQLAEEPNARVLALMRQGMILPCSHGLTDEELEYVCNRIQDFLAERGAA